MASNTVYTATMKLGKTKTDVKVTIESSDQAKIALIIAALNDMQIDKAAATPLPAVGSPPNTPELAAPSSSTTTTTTTTKRKTATTKCGAVCKGGAPCTNAGKSEWNGTLLCGTHYNAATKGKEVATSQKP